MIRRIIVLFWVIVLIISTFISCISFIKEAANSPLDPDLYGMVTYVKDEEGEGQMAYAGHLYRRDMKNVVCITEADTDVLLGWSGLRIGRLPFGHISAYYADTQDAPLFLYCPTRYQYLRDDYDYTTDTFVIEDTEAGIVYADALTYTGLSYPSNHTYEHEVSVTLHSVQSSRLQIKLKLFYTDGKWYAGNQNNNKVYAPSDAFWALLCATGYIAPQTTSPTPEGA